MIARSTTPITLLAVCPVWDLKRRYLSTAIGINVSLKFVIIVITSLSEHGMFVKKTMQKSWEFNTEHHAEAWVRPP